MTCVAWDGKTLAADRQCDFNGIPLRIEKIWRVGDVLIGGAGNSSVIATMLEWWKAGADPEKFPKVQNKDTWAPFVVLDGKTLRYYDDSPYPTTIPNQPYAWGSGRDFALCAMHLGKTAAEAVAITNELTMTCGFGVDTLTLE